MQTKWYTMVQKWWCKWCNAICSINVLYVCIRCYVTMVLAWTMSVCSMCVSAESLLLVRIIPLSVLTRTNYLELIDWLLWNHYRYNQHAHPSCFMLSCYSQFIDWLIELQYYVQCTCSSFMPLWFATNLKLAGLQLSNLLFSTQKSIEKNVYVEEVDVLPTCTSKYEGGYHLLHTSST